MPLPCLSFKSAAFCRSFAAATLLALAPGCAQVPELDATVPEHLKDAAYPALIPLDGSLATEILPADAASEIEDHLAGRRDRLQARAKRLNSPVTDPES